MAHLQYMPGDPRLVDQLVYELKSKGIFDQFRKECIADVDTRPAYQNLRQRVENSVSTFLARQCWKPDLNKNQLREKLRKHILDGNYLEQGVERIVDQVVNPKVASVFIPQVEDLVYNYLGISRKKTVPVAESSNGKITTEDLLPTDLEAVSPGSVKSNDGTDEEMDIDSTDEVKIDVDEVKDAKPETQPSETLENPKEETETLDTPIKVINDSNTEIDKSHIPLPTEGIKLENIPAPENSPPKVELEKIELPKEHNIPKEIPLPDGPKSEKEQYFKPISLNSDDDSSSDSSLKRNMSPLTPIRNYNNENSCDAQQAFDNDSDGKSNDKVEPSSFRFAIELRSTENSCEGKFENKDEGNLAYQFNNQVNINTFTTPMYDESSNSNNLHIDYESDVNSKNTEKVPETDHNSEDSKKDKKVEDKKNSHKSSHRSRDSSRHTSSKEKRSESKQSSSRDSSKFDKRSKEEHKSKSSHRDRDRSRERSDKKESRDSSRHSSSHKSSSHRDSRSHKSSSSSQRHLSKHSDDKKSSSSQKDKERSSDKSSKDRRDSKSTSHRSDKDKKSSSSSSKGKNDDKDKTKDKKEIDDHYSLSGRGNHTRRSTDRDSNDGSSSSKGSNNQSSSKLSETKKDSKGSSTKSDRTSTSGESTSPSDKEVVINTANDSKTQPKVIRVDNHLEVPIASPPRLPFVPDVKLKKPKFAANLREAKKMMRMRKFLDEEQKRMNQEAALLLEFQANVRPSLSQVYSSIPGPELEFACVSNNAAHVQTQYETEKMVIEPVNSESNDKTAITDVKAIQSDKQQTETINNDIEGSKIEENGLPEALRDRNETYNENKPFSQLVAEISKYSKASERNKCNDARIDNLNDDGNKNRTEYFEVTIITEELSETEDNKTDKVGQGTETTTRKVENIAQATENKAQDTKTEVQTPECVRQPSEKVPQTSEDDNNSENVIGDIENKETDAEIQDAGSSDREDLHYFAEHEKYDAELKRHQYSNFLKEFNDRNAISDKIYLFNCDTYEENIIRDVALTFGRYEIINYYRNGHLTLPKTPKNVVNVSLASEIALPVDNYESNERISPVFSPVKSECSFELSSDYDAKLEEMVNKTSRQEVMEIILGSVIDTEKPTIDYCTESSIDSNTSLKRKIIEAESSVNNNRPILIPKIRKLSESDIISSTTEETEVSNNNRIPNNTRSKYLGRARRVGLSRPRKSNLPNSPSSDKSVENYEQNTPAPILPNGKLKSTPPRNKVQRYDKTDLYKPKLHYLSRRNNIS